MKYNAESPKSYFSLLADDWRKEKLLSIRDFILSQGLKEDIEYNMLAYKDNSVSFFHLNAQKHFVGLYVGDIKKIDPETALLDGIDCGKGCLRLKQKNELDDSLKQFILKTIDYGRKGRDISC